MKNITAILVDDEISALKGLQQKIAKLFPDIEILDTIQNPDEAIKILDSSNPDIVFLDIEMPRMNGFELLTKLKRVDFQVIFVTAYSEYALKALKQSAVDYVLKPLDNNDLSRAIEKALEVIEKENLNKKNSKLIEVLTDTITNSNKIIVPTSKGLSFIPQDEVLHLEGYDGYTKFHLTNKTHLVSSYSLGKFEKSLSAIFFKCHKSHIINIEKVRNFENEGYVVLESAHRVPISKSNRKVFLDLFQ